MISSLANSFDHYKNLDKEVEELKALVGTKEEKLKLEEEISTIHINYEKTMQCLQEIIDYIKETMKNTILTIQIFQK